MLVVIFWQNNLVGISNLCPISSYYTILFLIQEALSLIKISIIKCAHIHTYVVLNIFMLEMTIVLWN